MIENRNISFSCGQELDVRLKNPIIKIHQEFDLSKDVKFSMRTLLLLCVFCIGVFGFGLNPHFFGYDLNTNYRAFVIFCMLVLFGQAFIAFFQYRLNREKLHNYLQMHEQEVNRLERECKSEESRVQGFKKNWDEALIRSFPQSFHGRTMENKEQLNDFVKPMYDMLNANYKQAKESLERAKKEKLYAEMVYKWINGKITFLLAVVAIILGCGAFLCDCSVVDKIWGMSNQEQYISLNINNIDTQCLLNTEPLAAFEEGYLF